MKNPTPVNTKPDLATLVRDLLGLNPTAVAALSRPGTAAHGDVASGVNELMRRVLEHALQCLWAPDTYQLRLRLGASARAPGYPDAKIFNIVKLFTYALVRAPRRRRGLSELVLCAVDTEVVDLPRTPDTDVSSTAKLAGAAAALFEPDFDAIRDAPGPDGLRHISVHALIRDTLGVAPEMLIRPYHKTLHDAQAAFARDPEGQAIAGLSALLTRVVHHYPLIVKAETVYEIDCVRFSIADEDTYEGSDGAVAANLGALLTAGLLADGTRDVAFFA